jgi:hypothetical protein
VSLLANLIRTRTYDDWKTTDRRDGAPGVSAVCTRCGGTPALRFPRAGVALCRDCSSKWDAEQIVVAPPPPPAPPVEMPAKARLLADAQRAIAFLLAGHAIVTLRNAASGNRFTFLVERAEKRDDREPPWFVSLLTGPQNTADYVFLGTVFDGSRFVHGKKSFVHGKKSKVGVDAPSTRAFAGVFAALVAGRIPRGIEVWHAGRCCKCGRTLTTPESVESGIGPVCADR